MKEKESITDIMADIRDFMLSRKSILTASELEGYIKIKVGTIYKYTMERKIPHYKLPGSKMLYFKRSEIDQWLLINPVETINHLKSKVNTSRKNNPKK